MSRVGWVEVTRPDILRRPAQPAARPSAAADCWVSPSFNPTYRPGRLEIKAANYDARASATF
jgi:hypothetical protein